MCVRSSSSSVHGAECGSGCRPRARSGHGLGKAPAVGWLSAESEVESFSSGDSNLSEEGRGLSEEGDAVERVSWIRQGSGMH